MQVAVLAIVINGSRKLSLHPTQASAQAQLAQFMDQGWGERIASTSPSIDIEDRAAEFFDKANGDFYAIIQADVSELFEALTAVAPEAD